MKKILFLAGFLAFILTGCLETTEEVTLNADGTGSLANTNDMSALLGLLKNMGGDNEAMEKLAGQKMDSSLSMASVVDSIPGLTEDDKNLLRTGTMQIKMDADAEKFLTKMNFNFSKISQISQLNGLTEKVLGKRVKDLVTQGAAEMGGDDKIPETSSIASYLDVSFDDGDIKGKVNKDKIGSLANDEFLKGLKELSGMGMTIAHTYVINLPRAASSVEGKNVVMSDDKKKATIKIDLETLFEKQDDISFKIKY
ncbi:MAG: hypothetical protein IPQ08_03730 [Chitinophagaceae bacterium]|nr:hypothetical protein [Chitinophagaceae bacterium]